MRRAIILLTLPLLALSHRACAAPLAVRTGQWSITVTMQMDGTFLPPETLAKLPPAARAKMAGVLAAMQQPTTNTSCLTAKKLAEGFDFGKHLGHHCQMQMLQQTSAMMEMRATCQEARGTMTEHGVFQALDPETMHGQFDVDRQGVGPKRMKIQFAGKWMGATCTGHEDDAD
jgi:hypothetical protein